MIAAIYARKSTDQNLPDAEKSVTRQIDHATAYAERKGWRVAPAYVYTDDGISGAEFVKRPGFLQLMAALKPRPPFQVLVMSEESRLGREQIETAWSLKQITDAGVRIFYYLEDRERTLDNALDKIMMQLAAFAAEMEREKAKQRTHDGQKRKFLAGHVTGGIVYGYQNVEVRGEQGQRVHVNREILPAHAAVLRRIFTAVAAGHGFSRIAKALNRDGVPAPRATSWSPTCIREMLHRELYRGRVVWNQTGWTDRGGTKKKIDRPASEWLTRDAPELRIIPEDLWTAAHARLRATTAAYRATGSAWGRGRQPGTSEGRYLLTSFLACASCGGSMIAWRRKAGHGPTAYRCAYHHCRGASVCANANTAPLAAVESAVLDGLRDRVLAPEILLPVIREGIARFDARAARPAPDSRRALERQRAELEQGLDYLATAVAQGKPPATLLAKIQTQEAAKAAVEAKLATLGAIDTATRRWSRRDMEHAVRRAVTEWRTLLAGGLDDARHVLRQLLPERLRCTPRPSGGYRITGEISLGGFIAAVVGHDGTLAMVPPG